MKSQLTVACNWDKALLKGLEPFAKQIKFIYGKTKTDVFSGGRESRQAQELEERKKAEEYINEAKDAGLSFNYLMNGVILQNNSETKKKIRQDLDWIVNTGATNVTISIPWLAEIVRDEYPQLKINTSVFAHVRTPQQVREWKNLGAKSICLDRNLIRNPKQIEVLRKADRDMEYTLLVNDPCRFNCAIELEHDRQMSQASISNENYFHQCSFTCLKDFINHPEKIIGSTFIRPEDLEFYENLGINNFKIVDRNRTTKYILNSVKAYANRNYNGNLMDLMSLFSSYDRESATPKLLKKEELNVNTIDKFWRELPSMIGISVDNNKLNNSVEKISKIECDSSGCKPCKVCYEYSDLVKYNKDSVKIATQNINLILDYVKSGGNKNVSK